MNIRTYIDELEELFSSGRSAGGVGLERVKAIAFALKQGTTDGYRLEKIANVEASFKNHFRKSIRDDEMIRARQFVLMDIANLKRAFKVENV